MKYDFRQKFITEHLGDYAIIAKLMFFVLFHSSNHTCQGDIAKSWNISWNSWTKSSVKACTIFVCRPSHLVAPFLYVVYVEGGGTCVYASPSVGHIDIKANIIQISTVSKG